MFYKIPKFAQQARKHQCQGKTFCAFLGMYLFSIQEGLRMKWNHTACTHISVRHRHALKKHIYTCIFGITCSLVAGLLGCQKHSSSHLTSELLFQKHSPARHNMPSSISSHLFPSSMGLYGPFSSHKTAFVRHTAFLLFFALKVFDVCTFPLDWMQFPTSQAAPNMSGVHRSSTVLYIM